LRTRIGAAHFAAWGLLGAIACAGEVGAEPAGRRASKDATVPPAHLVDPTDVGSTNRRLPHRRSPQLLVAGQVGIASVYGGDRHRGSKTASGERVQPGGLTAAHRSLPMGTRVRVTHMGNGRSVIVRINDRGPFVRGRIIDVTPAAARMLGFSGLARVSLSVGETGN
jgi:rare lipoprotein A